MEDKKVQKKSNIKVYARLLSYVLPYIPHFILSTFGFILLAGSQVAAAEWLKRIIDFVNNPIEDYRLVLPLALIVIALVRGFGFFIGNYLLALISNKLVHNLRTELFNKIMILPSIYFDHQTSGHLISRITFNVMQVTGAATNALKVLFREGLLVIGLICYLIYLNWQLTVVLFFTAPFIAIIVAFAAKRLRKISGRIQTAMGDVTHVASETINAYKEVKAFGGESYENKRFIQASENNRRQNMKLEATNYISSPIIQMFVSTGLAVITWLALDSSVITAMSSGTFIAFFGAAGMLARPVRQLSEINSQIQKGLAAAVDIFLQLDEEPEKDLGTYESENIKGDIVFQNVSFSYKSYDSISENVLTEINLDIQQGQTVALVGKSGAGKTTLVNLIPRFYQGYDGLISIDGTPIDEFTMKNLRSHISLVSQNITLFNDTVTKNINYGDINGSEEDVEKAALRAHADEFIRAMPDGYDTLVGDNGVLLSGGQRQRIAIARAILKDAPILILDEATSALDSESENFIQEAIEEVAKNRTTFIVAHRLSTIEKADLIVVLDKGAIQEVGTHKDLLAKKGHYADLHSNQFQDELGNEKRESIQGLAIEKIAPVDNSLSRISFLERAWNDHKIWLWALWPLSNLTNLISSYRRNKFYDKKNSLYRPKMPVIVVGNITVGGTGKTPLVISLANSLKALGYKPGIISRGYGGRASKYPLMLDKDTSASIAGDEPVLIYRKTGLPVVVGPNRVKALKKLIKENNCNIVISDDGLQHYKLNRDIEIAMIDGIRGLGNGLCVPAGPLREPVSRLKNVDLIVSSNLPWSNREFSANYLMEYKPIKWVRVYDEQSYPFKNWPLSKTVHVLAGIGNPSQFFNNIIDEGFRIIKHPFPDHYNFSKDDLIFDDDYPIIMTEKDAVRCKDIPINNLWYLEVEAEISDEFVKMVVDKIKEIKIE